MYIHTCRFIVSRLSRQVTPARLIVQFPVRNFHARGINIVPVRRCFEYNFRFKPIYPGHGCRLISTTVSLRNEADTNSTSTPPTVTQNDPYYIPEPPKIPSFSIEEVTTNAPNSALGEPAFSEIGLGSAWPSGWVQNAMEWLHIDMGLPWWSCIVITTVVLRLALFPLVVKSQKNAAKLANNLPQLQILQLKMTEARQSGNAMESARIGNEMMLFMKEKEISPFKSMLVPLAQMPIFMAMFFGLRGMTNVPVESMKYGGLFWFTDLTVPDEFYLLPLMTSATMYLTIRLGSESGNMAGQNSALMIKIFQAMPVVMFPFIMNFPSAMLCYWAVTNVMSLIQVGILRIPRIRDFFGIERLRKFSADELPVKNKSFLESFREAKTNLYISRELEQRKQYAGQLAGTGPVQKTYKYDPTRQKESSKTAQTIVQRGIQAASGQKTVK